VAGGAALLLVDIDGREGVVDPVGKGVEVLGGVERPQHLLVLLHFL